MVEVNGRLFLSVRILNVMWGLYFERVVLISVSNILSIFIINFLMGDFLVIVVIKESERIIRVVFLGRFSMCLMRMVSIGVVRNNIMLLNVLLLVELKCVIFNVFMFSLCLVMG